MKPHLDGWHGPISLLRKNRRVSGTLRIHLCFVRSRVQVMCLAGVMLLGRNQTRAKAINKNTKFAWNQIHRDRGLRRYMRCLLHVARPQCPSCCAETHALYSKHFGKHTNVFQCLPHTLTTLLVLNTARCIATHTRPRTNTQGWYALGDNTSTRFKKSGRYPIADLAIRILFLLFIPKCPNLWVQDDP